MDIRRHIIHPGGVWERFSLYLKQGGHAAVHREVARSLRLRTRDVVLDLGGGGHALAQLALYAGTVHGVDTSAAAVWAAISRNRHDVARGRVHVCRGTLPALPFPEAMFHVITAFEPAFWAGDLPACLREVRRLLRPGGQCVLVCASGRESGGPVPAGHTAETLNALADRAGLLCLPPLRLRGKGRVLLHWLQPARDLCRPVPLDVFPAGWAQAC